jgi:hypothetical protein
VQQLGVAFRRQAALARHQQHRVAGQQPDEGEGGDRHPDEGRDEEAQAGEDEAQHDSVTGPRLRKFKARGPDRAEALMPSHVEA